MAEQALLPSNGVWHNEAQQWASAKGWAYPALFFFPFIFISWRLITLQYCSGFCHTLI